MQWIASYATNKQPTTQAQTSVAPAQGQHCLVAQVWPLVDGRVGFVGADLCDYFSRRDQEFCSPDTSSRAIVAVGGVSFSSCYVPYLSRRLVSDAATSWRALLVALAYSAGNRQALFRASTAQRGRQRHGFLCRRLITPWGNERSLYGCAVGQPRVILRGLLARCDTEFSYSVVLSRDQYLDRHGYRPVLRNSSGDSEWDN